MRRCGVPTSVSCDCGLSVAATARLLVVAAAFWRQRADRDAVWPLGRRDHAVGRRRAVAGEAAELIGGRLEQLAPGDRRRDAHRRVDRVHRVRAAGELIPDSSGRASASVTFTLSSGRSDLVGDRHRDRGGDALADLGARQGERDGAVGVDGDRDQAGRRQRPRPSAGRSGRRRRPADAWGSPRALGCDHELGAARASVGPAIR